MKEVFADSFLQETVGMTKRRRSAIPPPTQSSLPRPQRVRSEKAHRECGLALRQRHFGERKRLHIQA